MTELGIPKVLAVCLHDQMLRCLGGEYIIRWSEGNFPTVFSACGRGVDSCPCNYGIPGVHGVSEVGCCVSSPVFVSLT